MLNASTVPNNIQTDLSVVVLPVVITALVSLITLIVNSFIKIAIENKKYNSEQCKLMQKLYPQLKYIFINIKLILNDIQKNKLFTEMGEALKTFIDYNQDSSKYRDNNQQQIEYIDDFIYSIDLFIKQMDKLHSIFTNEFIPSIPVVHPILKHKVSKMLSNLQYFSFIVSQCISDEISCDMIIKEIENYKPQKNRAFDNVMLDSYIKILDKWFLSY